MQCSAVMLAFAAFVLSSCPALYGSDITRMKRDAKLLPFMVSVRLMGRHRCSGAIIGENLVVTTAQCVQSVQENQYFLDVAVGVTANMLHQVMSVYVHPLYDPLNQDYNFALIQVEPPFKIGESVRAIEIAEHPMNSMAQGPAIAFHWDRKAGKFLGQSASSVNVVECAGVHGTTNRMFCAEVNDIKVDVGAPLIHEGRLHGILTTVVRDSQGSNVGIYSGNNPYLNNLMSNIKIGDSVHDKMCKALKTIIQALKGMKWIPSFIRAAVEYLFNMMKCKW